MVSVVVLVAVQLEYLGQGKFIDSRINTEILRERSMRRRGTNQIVIGFHITVSLKKTVINKYPYSLSRCEIGSEVIFLLSRPSRDR